MNKRTAYFILLTVLFLLSLGGCEKDTIQGEREECSLLLNLSSDFTYSIVTRSNAADSLFVTPELNDFQIQILNPSGKILKEWESYADIPQPIKIQTGTFTIKALSGEFQAGAFEQPYFEGTATVGIKKDELTKVNLICKLTNTIATAEYTEGFKHIFKDYQTEMSTTGEAVVFHKGETRAAFFEPGTLSVRMHLTKQDGTSFVFSAAQIDSTRAGEYYRFKFDATEENGGSALLVSFNDSTRENPVYIDLNQNWLPGDAPFCTLTGFTSGQSFENLEGEGVDTELSVLVTARNRIKSCKLKTTSDILIQKGWPAKEIELTNATEQVRRQLRAMGLKWTEKLSGLNMAQVDFSKVIPLLPVGENDESHSFTLEVIDQQNQTLQHPVVLKVLTAAPAFTLNAHNDIWVKTTDVDLNLNLQKGHIEEINLQYYNSSSGNWENVPYEINGNTGNLYNLKTQINFNSPLAQLRAVYGQSSRTSVINFNVLNPEFTIALAGLPWAKHVVLEAQQTNGDLLATNSLPEEFKIQILENGSADWKEVDFTPIEGQPTQFYVKGLTAGTLQKIKVIYNAGIGNQESSNQEEFTTENSTIIPNGQLEDWKDSTLNIYKGGRASYYKAFQGAKWEDYPPEGTTQFYKIPEWTTVNSKTIPLEARNKNTWYMVPSTLETSTTNGKGALIRNVAWHNNGEDVKNTAKTLFGSGNEPVAPTEFIRSSGKLFLGDYTVIHNYDAKSITETYNYGIPFYSRPQAIKFNYKYNSDNNDKGLVAAFIMDNNNNIIATLGDPDQNIDLTTPASWGQSLESNSNFSFKTLAFHYLNEQSKAAKLCILFASSNKANNDYTIENSTITTNLNQTNQFTDFYYYGSELYIDDIELVYE